MAIKYFSCLLLLVVFAHPAKGQQNEKASATIVVNEAIASGPQARIGTFELFTQGKGREILHTGLLEVIESNRHATEVVFFKLGENTIARILPQSVIDSPDFVPLKHIYADDAELDGGSK